jgi:Heterokaryon incompatibility protein (HET)
MGYTYSPLDSNTSEFRLVTIEPGEFDEPIRGSIHHAFLDDGPSFEALSYVWGDATVKEEIQLHGQPFQITKNLTTALRYIRHQDTDRVLWIDAICINQQDIPERSNQVPRMRNIYLSATMVLAWLGEPTPDSDTGMRCIKELGELFEDYKGTIRPRKEFTEDFCEEIGIYVANYSWPAIYGILRREYWLRIWYGNNNLHQDSTETDASQDRSRTCIVWRIQTR